jgi:hypothetical protein
MPTAQELMDGPYLGVGMRRARRPGVKCTDPLPRGHAAPIGSGPEGETCGSCDYVVRGDASRTYFKCSLMREIWTGGRATDVRAGDGACRRWHPQPEGKRP